MQTAAMGLKDGTDTLFLGRVDEAAGIDENDIGIIGLRGQLITVARGITEENFCVDQIFCAAKADQSDLADCGWR
jgi:hypothetical protein